MCKKKDPCEHGFVMIEHLCKNPPRPGRDFEHVHIMILKLGDPDRNWEDMDQWEHMGLMGFSGPGEKYFLTYEQAEKFYGEGSCHLEHYTPLRVVK
jgi:hypothetical protein